jgi:membrane-associated protease RseP (regulator of RpoE activity)
LPASRWHFFARNLTIFVRINSNKTRKIMKKPIKMLFPLLTLLLAACVAPQTRTPTMDKQAIDTEAQKQKELVIEAWLKDQGHLQTVSSKILTSGTSLCGEHVGPYFGVDTWTKQDLTPDWQAAAESRYSLGDEIQISFVVPGSPAETAGLKAGDVVLSLNDKPVVSGKEAGKLFAENLKGAGKLGPVEFVVRRDYVEQKFQVTPSSACDFQTRLAQNSEKNAYADGKNIVVNQGMMDFFKSDDEMALVLSHELAHNAMRHMDAQKTNATIGSLVGLLLDVAAAVGGVNTNGNFSRLGSNVAAGAFSVEFEQEADYVGLYFMSLAGYKIDDAANFWRRMATADPRSITMKSSHPTSPERFVAIENAVEEIDTKIAAAQPLEPELKNKKTANASGN